MDICLGLLTSVLPLPCLVFDLYFLLPLSLGFQRDQAEESLCFRTEQYFPTSVQPAETPGVYSEFCGAVGISQHLRRGRG